jgi:hypothetical protein
MKRLSPHGKHSVFFLFLTLLLAPSYALAGSVTAHVSASSIASLGEFQVTMTSSGVDSCTWSRLDNGTTWAWENVPLPSGTAYDSGTLSGWAGEATYEWRFSCVGDWGATYSASAMITISGEEAGLLDDITNILANVVDAVVDVTTNPDPATTPAITVLPTPLNYPPTETDEHSDITLVITNTGGADSRLTGTVSIAGDPSFTCPSECSYTDVPPGPGKEIVIRFDPDTEGSKTATVDFSGGGGATVPATGTGITPSSPIVTNPLPLISVSPSPTLFFYNVELNDYRDKVFTVKNVGPAGTALSGSVFVEPGFGYTCRSGCTYTDIGANTEHPVTLRFAPTVTAGTRIADVTFSGGGGATRLASGDAHTLAITETLHFENIPLDRTATQYLRITNPSNITHAGSGTVLIPTPFACIGACHYNLPPGAHQDFLISFTPTGPEEVSMTGSLSNFPNSALNISGNGVRQYFRVREQ